MTAAIDTRTEVTDRELRRSPGLAQFRKSPFRVLRLAPTATAKQAVWQCDKALARARVGMSLPDPDPVPWLPPADEIEIQEAAQTVESPLARMIEQLLWFDGDGDGAALVAALTAGDGPRLAAYLEPVNAPSIPHRINAANLRLLLGFSMLREVGPTLGKTGAAAATSPLDWKATRGGLSLVEDPHKLMKPSTSLLGTTWAALLGDGVTAWGEMLAAGELADHVRAKIAALGDELLSADDLEAVISGLRTRIADLIVGETKLEIGQGRLDSVSSLSAIAGRSKIDAETWLVAFRPLKTQFESELADLAPDAETGLGVVEDVSAYLDRVATLAQRWRPIDEAQLLGLSALIDDAVAEAFAKLRAVPRETQLGERFGEVLHRIGQVGNSPSLKERVKGYKERLVDVAKSMCHFCGKRELEPAFCASVSSKMEISRTRYGNTIRVQYQVGALPVARCQHCALLHSFIKSIGFLGFMTLATSVLLVAIIHPSTWFSGVTTGAGFAMMLIGVGLAFCAGFLVRQIIAGRVTPKGERRYSDYLGTRAVEVLRGDGFTTFKYDFRPDAWEIVNKQGVASAHSGGAAGQALRTLLYIGAFIALIALRVCMGSHH